MRLTDVHPLNEKFRRLLDLADELQLRLDFSSYRTILTDLSTGKSYDVEDIEGANIPVTSFPPESEVKIVYEKL